MPFYTRKGDDGLTGLLGEGRVPKHDLRPETLGTIDEATAALGMARYSCRAAQSAPLLMEIQRDLYRLMAEVAATPENADKFHAIDAGKVAWLEAQIETLNEFVKLPEGFILPGDSMAGAALDLARTIVRRAERRVSELLHNGELANRELLRYLNRLSSLCFVLELLENQAEGQATTMAKGPE